MGFERTTEAFADLPPVQWIASRLLQGLAGCLAELSIPNATWNSHPIVVKAKKQPPAIVLSCLITRGRRRATKNMTRVASRMHPFLGNKGWTYCATNRECEPRLVYVGL